MPRYLTCPTSLEHIGNHPVIVGGGFAPDLPFEPRLPIGGITMKRRKSGSQWTHRWREMDSNHRSPVKDQLVETVLFDFQRRLGSAPSTVGESQPRDLGGDLRRDHNLRDDNDRLAGTDAGSKRRLS
jgi:hypothetical protein